MDPPRLKPRIQSPRLVEAPKRIQLELKRQAAPAPERIELKPTPSLVIESAPQLELPPDELPEIAQPKIQVGGFSTAAADLERHKPKLKLASIGFGAASAGATRRATPQAKVVGFGSASTSAVVGKPARRPSTAAFGTATAGQTAGGPAAPSSPSSYRPIRIMKKPQPVYTQEARANESRRRRAAGGALWRRQPSQSAQSRTRTRIWTRPSAIAAAQGIQFEPAKQFGRPVSRSPRSSVKAAWASSVRPRIRRWIVRVGLKFLAAAALSHSTIYHVYGIDEVEGNGEPR